MTRTSPARKNGWSPDANFIDAHIKSREGIEATVFAVYVDGKKDFTELDRAVFGTLADLASLALSQ
jgi:hypothetical protein